MSDPIVSCLYNNTEAEINQGSDTDLRSRVNVAMMELSSFLYMKDSNTNLAFCAAMLDYCKWTHVSCESLYVSNRTATNREVVYTLADRFTYKSFDIIVERESNVYHVGVLLDFVNKGGI